MRALYRLQINLLLIRKAKDETENEIWQGKMWKISRASFVIIETLEEDKIWLLSEALAQACFQICFNKSHTYSKYFSCCKSVWTNYAAECFSLPCCKRRHFTSKEAKILFTNQGLKGELVTPWTPWPGSEKPDHKKQITKDIDHQFDGSL